VIDIKCVTLLNTAKQAVFKKLWHIVAKAKELSKISGE
jgi:hypothetical protein